jgi:hypothetical protein
MTINRRIVIFEACVLAAVLLLSSRLRADTGTCNGTNFTLPFTDVMGHQFFCQIAAAYFTGLTNGTTATTYTPNDAVSRGQMAAFITRTLDGSLKRGNRRAALGQWATPSSLSVSTATTLLQRYPRLCAADGADIWVALGFDSAVQRVRASDGKLLETWQGVNSAEGVLVARGRIWVSGGSGHLYKIDPAQTAGSATPFASNLGLNLKGLASDGYYIWVAGYGTAPGTGAVTRIDSETGYAQTFYLGFNRLYGALFDGANLWVTDQGAGTLLKLDLANGAILQTVTVGSKPKHPVFDGANIWVPSGTNADDSALTVVRATTGEVLAQLSGNGLNGPEAAAFDGQRIMVTNYTGNSVSLWRATDFAQLGNFAAASGGNIGPVGVCSDGINFWIALYGPSKLVRF